MSEFNSGITTVDESLRLADPVNITADASGTHTQVGGAAATIDLGAAGTMVDGTWYVNVTGRATTNNDEVYHFALQGSDTAAFTTKKNLALLDLSDGVSLNADDIELGTGLYRIPFTNTLKTGTSYRYLRLLVIATSVAGAPDITFESWLSK